MQHQAEAVEVALHGRRAAAQDFRRHVGRSADHRCAVHAALAFDRDAEIGDADVAVAVDHDVLRLQIAMEHAVLVGGEQPETELASDLQRFVRRQATDAAQQRFEIFAVDVLHRQERHAVDFADVVDSADVRVRHAAREPCFRQQLVDEARIRDQRSVHELQSDRDGEAQVIAQVDAAHASLAELPHDAVTLEDGGARLEGCGFDPHGERQVTSSIRQNAPRKSRSGAERHRKKCVGSGIRPTVSVLRSSRGRRIESLCRRTPP
jgi:hypothetical protein